MNRRELIRLLAAVPVASPLVGLDRVLSPLARDSRLAHALLFDAARIPALQQLYLKDSFFAAVRDEADAIDRAGTRQFIASEIRLNDQITDLPRMSRTAEAMALHFLLAGDADAGQLAKECVRTILKFPKWDYFIDGEDVIGIQRASEASIAIALCSDWLGDSLPDSERRHWLEVNGERGCQPCYNALYDIANPRQVTGWRFDPESTITKINPNNHTDLNRRPEITETTNLRAIPACGLVMGTIALRDIGGDKATTDQWLALGIESVKAFGNIYRPDGSYHEGVSYAQYTSEHITQAMTVLQRKESLDIRNVINWDGHAEYLLNMSMPTTDDSAEVVNFGDNGNAKDGRGQVARSSTPFWIAANAGSNLAQWFGKNLAGKADSRSLFFYDQQVSERAPSNGNRLWESDLDWVVARNGYRADDLVVAMRSGGPANHEHADRNSIIVKCFGQQLIADPYRPPYNFADPAWLMRLTQGHSAVLIDGNGHEHHNGVEGTNASQSWARIVSSEQHSDYATWMSDASQPYRLVDIKIALVQRRVVVLYGVPGVIVIDRVVKRENASTVQSRYFGFNWDGQFGHEITANGFSLIRPGAALRAVSHCNAGLDVTAGRLPIEEARARRHPFVQVATASPAMEITMVTAMGIGRTLNDAPIASLEEDGADVIVRLGGKTITVSPNGDASVA